MPKIKFTTNGANSLIGGFAAGDVLVCSAALARHLVDEARCARYADPAAAGPQADAVRKPAATRKARGPRDTQTKEPTP